MENNSQFEVEQEFSAAEALQQKISTLSLSKKIQQEIKRLEKARYQFENHNIGLKRLGTLLLCAGYLGKDYEGDPEPFQSVMVTLFEKGEMKKDEAGNEALYFQNEFFLPHQESALLATDLALSALKSGQLSLRALYLTNQSPRVEWDNLHPILLARKVTEEATKIGRAHV